MISEKSLRHVRLCSPWNSQGQNTGMGSLSLLQGNLPNPGIKPKSPALQADSLPAEPQGSPRILEWVAYSFSSASSQPRNQTGVSGIVGGFFTSCLQCGRPRFNPWVGKIPWRRKWQPSPVFLPGESHGGRSLVGYWGRL